MSMIAEPHQRFRSTQHEAEYLGEVATELARIARNGHLEFLAQLLEMAAIEASDVARGNEPTRVTICPDDRDRQPISITPDELATRWFARGAPSG